MAPVPALGPVERTTLSDERTDAISESRLKRISGPSRPQPAIPLQSTGLVGRAAELAQVQAILLDNTTRLLTLTGPGGAGKTRIALATTADLRGGFRDGTWFADLTSVRDPDLVLPAIARMLRITEIPGHALEQQVAADLAGAELLLVLDNFEQ